MFVFASTDRGFSCSCLPPLTDVFHVHICLHRQRCFMFMFASTDRGVSCLCLPLQTDVFHVHICLHRQRCFIFASTDRSVSYLPPQTEVFHVHICLHRQRCFVFMFASTDRGVSCSCLPLQTEVLGADSSVVNAALPLPSRNVTKRVDMLRPLYDHIITRTYRFPTNSGEELSTYEYLGESKLTFLLPVQLL